MTRLILITLLFFSPLTYAANHCVVLQYHHFSNTTPTITSVTLEQFDAQIDYLKKHSFNIMPLRDVVVSIQHEIELPDKCVSFSVDDAYLSVYQNAYPKFKELNWPFTVFVNTQAVNEKVKSYMSWAQMREMAGNGAQFENHSHSHTHTLRKRTLESKQQWIQRIKIDIQKAQSLITQQIGDAPILFAHPYGEYNPDIINLIKMLDLTGFGQQSGPVWPDANMGALPRFPMAAQYANIKGFITKVNTLPLPVVKAEPANPLVAIGETQPSLRLQLADGQFSKANLNCFVSGSSNISLKWLDHDSTVTIRPKKQLSAGRHRTNCTMPSSQKGRFHWYSHNWFIRESDGSWYAEY